MVVSGRPATELNWAPIRLAIACKFAFPYCWATTANCCWASAGPAGVMLTEYHGRNIDTARTAEPSAEIKRPHGTGLSTMAVRLSAGELRGSRARDTKSPLRRGFL